ncbi:Alpha-glucosidase YihQ [Ananas comosus]|uniref:Alpha-glucosidase YihQ n=1 Tax=Ananas comosus TaxID=4615 RepID=A0A199UUY5_ANACO|nr:Alpha-glucosidase YihQ [Ananas comosus]
METHNYKTSKRHHTHINNPFPSPPKSLPLIHASLSFDPSCSQLSLPRTFPLGSLFHLSWSPSAGGSLSLSLIPPFPPPPPPHHQQPLAFLSAAAVETQVEESRGSFAVEDGAALFISHRQTVEKIKPFSRDCCRLLFQSNNSADDAADSAHSPALVVTGLVFAAAAGRNRRAFLSARYWFLLEQKSETQVGFRVAFGEYDLRRSNSPRNALRPGNDDDDDDDDNDDDGAVEFREFNRVFLTHSSEGDEKFYGFGEQFSHVEFKGKRVPILVQEQGIGRGDQPITFAANFISYRSGGDWSTTYAPSPFYVTSKMRSLYLEGYDYSIFDLTKHDRVQIQIHGNSAQGRILSGNSPVEIIQSFTEAIGRPPILPDWIISGAVVGMQGGTEAVRRVWDQLQDHDVPISAFWLQDWVGQRETIIGSQLWWNWEVDAMHYAGWRELISDLRDRNIRMMTYCNPCLVPTDAKPNSKLNMFEEAKRLGILVKDRSGETYVVPNTAFDVGMLDFTHPKASSWFKKILRDMVDCGVRGWMADFGEGLPLDAHLYSGENPIAAHNRYPELWARVNREFVDEWKSTHREEENGEDEEGLVFFMRSAFRGSLKWAMLFWEGDQMVSWQKHDGIKSSVTGLLSSGLSGFAFNHSDIGGYCAVDLPIIRYRRSEELLMRWMELSAFSVVFRTHEGNKPSRNCQFYSNGSTLAHFARCAKIYKAWKFYRVQLVKEAAEKGLPVARHLFLHYPNDENVHKLTYEEFLIGSEILVVPVLDKGKNTVKAYFPLSSGCSWKHMWTGKVFSRPLNESNDRIQGFEAQVEAPIGYPAIFVKIGSSIGETFIKNLKDLNIL